MSRTPLNDAIVRFRAGLSRPPVQSKPREPSSIEVAECGEPLGLRADGRRIDYCVLDFDHFGPCKGEG